MAVLVIFCRAETIVHQNGDKNTRWNHKEFSFGTLNSTIRSKTIKSMRENTQLRSVFWKKPCRQKSFFVMLLVLWENCNDALLRFDKKIVWKNNFLKKITKVSMKILKHRREEGYDWDTRNCAVQFENIWCSGWLFRSRKKVLNTVNIIWKPGSLQNFLQNNQHRISHQKNLSGLKIEWLPKLSPKD